MNILVTGATGNVGAHVVRDLLERGVATRALVRDRQQVTPALGRDVEIVVGDFADRESLDRAMRGIDRLFLACGNVPDQITHECAAIDAAQGAGVTRIVKLSGPRATVESPLVFERWHGEIERHLLASGLPSVLLRPRPYMTNLLANADTINHIGTLFAPAASAEIAFVDPRDVAAAAATALATDGHDGATYELSGPEAITYERIAEDLSTATGRRIGYVDVPDDAARQGMVDAGMPAMIADIIVAIFDDLRTGSMAAVTDAVRALTGRPPRSFAQFARDHAALFAAGALVGGGSSS